MTAVVKVRVTPPQSVHVVTTPPPTLRVITGGIRGASAYESALTHGFVGTEAEWLASLAGGGTSIEGIADVPGLTAALAGKQPTGAYVLDSDSRLSNARTPTTHTHPLIELTGVNPAAIGAATTAQGTKADTAVQPAALTGLVVTTDPRLSDDRNPTAHTHVMADLTDYVPGGGSSNVTIGAVAPTPATGVQNVWFQDLGAGNWTINLVTGD